MRHQLFVAASLVNLVRCRRPDRCRPGRRHPRRETAPSAHGRRSQGIWTNLVTRSTPGGRPAKPGRRGALEAAARRCAARAAERRARATGSVGPASLIVDPPAEAFHDSRGAKRRNQGGEAQPESGTTSRIIRCLRAAADMPRRPNSNYGIVQMRDASFPGMIGIIIHVANRTSVGMSGSGSAIAQHWRETRWSWTRRTSRTSRSWLSRRARSTRDSRRRICT